MILDRHSEVTSSGGATVWLEPVSDSDYTAAIVSF